jgi:hypothetical protein
MPSWENCIEDWETKIDTIVEETFDDEHDHNLRNPFVGANVF